MAAALEHHLKLVNGEGKCSKPMWDGYGGPAGFCDEPAFGPPGDNDRAGYWDDGRFFRHYIPGLACYRHGGPKELNAQAHGSERSELPVERLVGTEGT